MKGGGELTFPSRECPSRLFSETIQFCFVLFCFLEKIPSLLC